jgi:hypothetical protein
MIPLKDWEGDQGKQSLWRDNAGFTRNGRAYCEEKLPVALVKISPSVNAILKCIVDFNRFLIQ